MFGQIHSGKGQERTWALLPQVSAPKLTLDHSSGSPDPGAIDLDLKGQEGPSCLDLQTTRKQTYGVHKPFFSV